MKLPLLALVLSLVSGPLTRAAALADEPPAGAVSLLNGRDLAGWYLYLGDVKPAADAVVVNADGVIRFGANMTGYFVTEKTFSNYRLSLEWRWPADAPANTNGGVFVHLRKPDALWPVCIEAQLANKNAGQLVGQGGVDVPGAPLINGKKRAPKLRESSEKPIGEWNTYEIVCRGRTLEVSINGVRQNRIEGLPIDSGAVGFQLEKFPFEVRRIWLSPL